MLRLSITAIHPDVFTGMRNLTKLYILDGDLTTIPPLHQISRTLEILALDGNDISDTGISFNDDFPALRTLAVPRNRLTYFPNIEQISGQLEILDLSRNCMKLFDNLYTLHFFKLLLLDLTKTCLKYISLSNLHMPMLRVLRIEDNLLVSLEPTDHLKLGDPLGEDRQLLIMLRNNPWHCNESFSWLYKKLEDHTIDIAACMMYRNTSCTICISDARCMACETPKQYFGKYIKTMGK